MEEVNENSTKAPEIFIMIVVALSLLMNIFIIHTIFKTKRDAPGNKIMLGLKLVLVVAIFDLMGPFIGTIQEVLSVYLNRNIMTYPKICQILGFLHTIVPYTSSNLIAIISIERRYFVHNNPIRARYLVLIGIIHFLPALILSSLAGWYGDFELSESRLVCMMSTRQGFYGKIYFYLFVTMLLVNMLIIFFCYISIMKLGFRTRSLLFNYHNKPYSHHQNNQDEEQEQEKEKEECEIKSNQVYITSNNLGSNDSLVLCRRKKSVDHDSYHTKSKYRARQFLQSHSFVLRACLIMITYIIILAPCIGFLIYEAHTETKLDFCNASIFVMVLFSFTMMNPLLLILLHTTISQAFNTSLRRILRLS